MTQHENLVTPRPLHFFYVSSSVPSVIRSENILTASSRHPQDDKHLRACIPVFILSVRGRKPRDNSVVQPLRVCLRAHCGFAVVFGLRAARPRWALVAAYGRFLPVTDDESQGLDQLSSRSIWKLLALSPTFAGYSSVGISAESASGSRTTRDPCSCSACSSNGAYFGFFQVGTIAHLFHGLNEREVKDLRYHDGLRQIVEFFRRSDKM
jgi:hypothetical protein